MDTEITTVDAKPTLTSFKSPVSSSPGINPLVKHLADLAESTAVLDSQEGEAIIIAAKEVDNVHALKYQPSENKHQLSRDEFSALIENCLAGTTRPAPGLEPSEHGSC